ncbi:recombinase family protein [Pseudonocardia sp.]|uniref:recombinase family protein n=1 Tax=Pseudonocardia sp. TaxID=60912 RepID=UPI002626F67A|nr:recombinase family protein [Pseudonocardia sp.]
MTARTARSLPGGTRGASRRRSAGSGTQGAQDGAARPVMIGYVRVSTAGQAESGLGLDAQEAALREEASRRGWDLEIVADRGKSGKRVNPALRSALDDLSAGLADGLVVAKLDRLARSVVHAADIMEAARAQGWNLVVLDLGMDLSTPQGRALAQTMAVFAELERELISIRTCEAMGAAKARGVKLGRPRLVPTSVARRIVRARDAGESFGAIARDLTERGVLSPSGRPSWQESTVRRIYTSARQTTPTPRTRKASA